MPVGQDMLQAFLLLCVERGLPVYEVRLADAPGSSAHLDV